MGWLFYSAIFFVLINISLEQSDNLQVEDYPPYTVNTGRALHNGTFIPTYGVYLLGFTIVLLGIAVVGLIVYVWHLKRSRYTESIVSVSGIRKVDNDTYTRQLSAETHILLTPLPNHNENFKLSEEKITIECPIEDTKHIEDRVKLDLPQTNRVFINTPPVRPLITPDQMKTIVTGVLNKSKRKEFASLSNLDKIINEGLIEETQSKEREKLNVPKSGQIERCSSTPLLDIIDDLPANKTNNNKDSKKSSINSMQKRPYSNKSREGNTSNSKSNSNIEINKPDELYNNPPNNKDVVIDEIKEKISKINRSSVDSRACLINDSNEDDVYDNLQSHARPISSNIDFIEEVYETGPSNRPVTLKDIDLLDDIYDNPKSEQNIKLVDELMKKINSRDDYDVYDKPRSGGREIMLTNSDTSCYLMAFTKDTEECLGPDYTNAKQLKT